MLLSLHQNTLREDAMFNYRFGKRNVPVLRRVWYIGDAQNLRSRWIVQEPAPAILNQCNNLVILACDTEARSR